MNNFGSYPGTRLRWNRKKDWTRRLVQENTLSTNDLIWPIFICEGRNVKEPIKTMPDIYRYSIDRIERLVEFAIDNKIPMIALFPYIPISKKNYKGLSRVFTKIKFFAYQWKSLSTLPLTSISSFYMTSKF